MTGVLKTIDGSKQYVDPTTIPILLTAITPKKLAQMGVTQEHVDFILKRNEAWGLMVRHQDVWFSTLLGLWTESLGQSVTGG